MINAKGPMKMTPFQSKPLSSVVSVIGLATSLILGAGAMPGSAFAAPAKGTLYLHLHADPSTLNPVTASDAYASEIQDWVFDTLLQVNDETYDWLPRLAEKWEISKDNLTYTFKIRDGVKWHDGKPLTAEDVKYSFDVYFEGRFQGPQRRVYIDSIKEIKIIDPRTVQFIMKEVYFKNLEVLGSYIRIIPKHIYGSGDPNDPKFSRELVGTGPYTLQEWNKGQKITLKRNPDYWGNGLPYQKDRFKFDKLVFRPVKEDTVTMEMLKKGDLDFLDMRTMPEKFAKDTKGPEWGKKVFAVKAENKAPQLYSFGFVGWNLKNPLFEDKLTRQALSHLINRPLMIEKFRYNLSVMATGPFGATSPASSPKVKPIPFDPKKGLELLKKAGWNLGPNGLTKSINGQETKLEFTLLCANPDFEKYLTIMKEDMKNVGVTLNIKIIEWNSFTKALDERKFDAVTMGWQVNSLDDDPIQIWHSKSIQAPGSNFISYSNPKIDQLIDTLRVTLDKKKRQKMYHEIHEILADEQPYSFLFNGKYYLYANSARVLKPKDTLKYSVGVDTWGIKATAGE